jgi:hypothetical protein
MSPLRSSAKALLLLSLATGCGPRWTVIRQATPDPFLHRPQFAVERLHFEWLRVGDKTEAEYMAEKTPEQKDSWDADKARMVEAFARSVAEAERGIQITPAPVQGGSIVRPIVTFIEPGFYAAIASGATRVHLTVQLLDAWGRPLDEIRIESAVPASMTNAASGTRMRQAAEDLGEVTAKYMQTRVSPD